VFPKGFVFLSFKINKPMKVRKTTFEEEQKAKDEAFLKLTPYQRLEQANKVREKMRKSGVNYSYAGMKVTIKRLS
jgi:hypothetical protein